MSTSIAKALIADLDDEAVDDLAARLAPHLVNRLDVPTVEVSQALLTCAEAASQAGTHVETIRRAVRRGLLPSGRAGRAIRIKPADLEAWLGSGARSSRPTPAPRARRRATVKRPLAEALARVAQDRK
jgi:excisionase family DNA binding protein